MCGQGRRREGGGTGGGGEGDVVLSVLSANRCVVALAATEPAPKTKRLPVASRAAHFVSTKANAPEFVHPVEFEFIQ